MTILLNHESQFEGGELEFMENNNLIKKAITMYF